ncbi:MAG TPA: PfkB family carbohydrate kinase [Acidobacteriaceae bacterium]|nr:PfkB family carbohydrate kinase [Acidobacteriaceae bacterium]
MTTLAAILQRLDRTRVLLIGDTILDIYTYGTALGLSAETPTIVARRKEVRYSLGGAALVARNLLELGASVQFLTLVGADDEAAHVRQFASPRLTLLSVEDAGRPTTVKHRFWVDGYKLFQLDQRDDEPVSAPVAERALALTEAALPAIDIVIISDYRHGLLSSSFLTALLPRLHAAQKAVYVDSQVSQTAGNHALYRGGCIMVLNLREARCIDPAFSPSVDPSGFSVLNQALDTTRIVVKLGEQGALFQDGSSVFHAPARPVTVTDTTGAGDAFLSAFCLAGLEDPPAALQLANAWAGLSVQIHGTIPPRKADLAPALGL